MIQIEDFQPEVVILGAGDFPQNSIPRNMLSKAKRVQCCDGAAASYMWHYHEKPWRIVGDGDSLPDEIKKKNQDIVRQIDEQDDNDQTKNVRYAAGHGYKRIAILGATGKREDHTLGNISLLIDYMEMGLEVRMYTDHGVFIPCNGSCEVSFKAGGAVSVFNFGCTEFSCEGLQYSLYPTTRLWQGTLNKCLGDTFSITANGPYLLFLNY